jgi:amino acid transporter
MTFSPGLRRDALSLPALFFCIATAAAPMTALLFNVPVIVSGAGWAAPAAFLVAAAMLAVFSIGYAQMSGRVRSAGGFHAVWTLLFGAFWSWVGFEMAPSYGEETRRRPGILAAAMLGTLLVLTVVYVVVSSAFVAYGVDGVAAGVGAQFEGEVASAFFPLTDQFASAWLTHAFQLLIITSAFACQLAFLNTAARSLFALGREGVLPRALGRTHGRRQTPHVASAVLAGVLAPMVGAVLMAFSAWLLLDNRGSLAVAEGVPFVEAIPLVVLVVFVVGAWRERSGTFIAEGARA